MKPVKEDNLLFLIKVTKTPKKKDHVVNLGFERQPSGYNSDTPPLFCLSLISNLLSGEEKFDGVSMGNHHKNKHSAVRVVTKIRKILIPFKSNCKKNYSHRNPFISVFIGLHVNPETT